jgi:hypothetical protein
MWGGVLLKSSRAVTCAICGSTFQSRHLRAKFCSNCQNAAANLRRRSWYQKHIDVAREEARQYSEQARRRNGIHPKPPGKYPNTLEGRRARNAAYAATHRAESRDRSKKWRKAASLQEDNVEKRREQQRRYRCLNKEVIAERHRNRNARMLAALKALNELGITF